MKKNIVKDYFTYYKENFMRKHIIIFIISLIMFMVSFSIGMSNIDFKLPLQKDINEIASIKLIQVQFLLTMVITQVIALIPLVKNLSIVTIFYSYFIGFNIVNMFYMPNCNKTFLGMFSVFSLFALSLNIMLSFEISDKVNAKFLKIVKKDKNDKKSFNLKINCNNSDENKCDEFQNEVYNKMYVTLTSVTCMIITIISLIITKFI